MPVKYAIVLCFAFGADRRIPIRLADLPRMLDQWGDGDFCRYYVERNGQRIEFPPAQID